jgi:hypothetical protein
MRLPVLTCVCTALLLPFAAAANAPSAAPTQRCESTPGRGERLTVTCSVTTSSPGTALRIQANFAGGHDDTEASMAVQLGGAPLPCSTDSKLQLMGEEGEVSLHCSFTLPAPGTHVVEVQVKWSHAQFVDYALR